jgi:hypothetical protein
MARPKLSFACELEPGPLQVLFTEAVIQRLVALKATLCLGILDLSEERAAIVRRLNNSGVPVVAWLLLPKDQGYWFNAGNASQALDRYEQFRNWSAEHDLSWAGIGLDIEPDIRDLSALGMTRGLAILKMLPRLFYIRQMRQARTAYRALVALIHAGGYPVESYQFALIADERRVGSTVLQRLAGVVDLSVDREIWMLYTSQLRPNGAGILASYAPEAQAIGLGVTGGGVVETGLANPAPLSWEEFDRDLRLAWLWCDDLFIFSLEGCVEQGFLDRLQTFDWDRPILTPDTAKARADAWRGTIQSGLWLLQRLPYILVGVVAGLLAWRGFRYYRRR